MTIKIQATILSEKYENPFELYKKLSDNGNNISLLFESKSQNQKYPRKSIIVTELALKISGKKEKFEINALNKAGEELLEYFSKKDFPYAENIKQGKGKISGKVEKKENKEANEEENTKLSNISFVIKTILKKFE